MIRAAVALVLVLSIAGCTATSGSLKAGIHPKGKVAIRWILVEKSAEEIYPVSLPGGAEIDRRSKFLVWVPIYMEDLSWEVMVNLGSPYVVLLSLIPGEEARPGETVTAKVHVGNAKPGTIYRLRPSRTRRTKASRSSGRTR